MILPSFFNRITVFLLPLILLQACSGKQSLFTPLPAHKTGIYFKNTITENNNDSTLISEFAYMGGGVGIGDFNNDGKKDIFFSANQVSSRLYINNGHLQFQDQTEKAGVATHVWATGVSIVDINNDGFDDIYLCVFGKNLKQPSKNLLFINQHDLTFKEQAEEYGLADTGYSTQAAFLDYDKDGDLDMYLLNYRLNGPNANDVFPKDLSGKSVANDRLYRNDGDSHHQGHPHFTDVSAAACIKEDGYGLGVAVSDYNGDNWPDIYVANDFLSNDELWLNNKNGTFTNCISRTLKHQSYSSMGADAADINNDALPDVVTLDMMPEYNERKKLTYSFMNYERYELERSLGYEPEFMRNMLQLNNGVQIHQDTALPFFSEIGQLANISETDWSWSVLMADFNNDGWKDMHITNGIGRDYINADFIQYSASLQNLSSEIEKRKLLNKRLAALEHVELKNYLYLNNRDYTFKDQSIDGGIGEPSLSGGAAYADLDNDGDLDLVVNNINKDAFVLLNNTIQKNKPETNHSLQVILRGNSFNKDGIGSKVLVYQKGLVQMQEQMPVRGYMSSVDRTLIFGLGSDIKVDSLVVTWSNDKKQTLTNIRSDQAITLFQNKAVDAFSPAPLPTAHLFTDVTSQRNALYQHKDVPVNDFAWQRLLPQKYSQLGPFITTGDVNGDGMQDFFAGGGFNSKGQLFLQDAHGTFQSIGQIAKDPMQEDSDCLFFDADGDGDQDLLITYGDIRYEDTSGYYTPRLFINDGKGNFQPDHTAIPGSVKTIAGCVRAADFDKDGDLDLFIGGRVSKSYPASPQSFLLQNDHGKFTDVTLKVCPELKKAGMITSVVWADVDQDQQPEIIIAGEWMPIRFFKNIKGRFKEITNMTGLDQNSGMWRSLIAVDADKDGDLDLIAGNLGQNCKYHISPTEPMILFAKDLDKNGSIDPIPFYYIRDGEKSKHLYPAINRDLLADQVPAVKKKFLKHEKYAMAAFQDIFQNQEGVIELMCNETSSCYFENTGKGKFIKHPLPKEAQFAPVNAILCDDFDGDGINDLLIAGNEYHTEVMTGRYDASYGLFLKGTKKGFIPVPPIRSGFIVNGDVRSMTIVNTKDKSKLVVVGINDDSLRIFSVNTGH
ncbi:VCBS repeat-containing protein [Chitinophagaceae bacterium LB-8]|uniref:VCBS repeat-containing protein n=1 Tax=Paraflavisolibacter caeni TaxID=2982496 RepID=A0A9X3B8T2_9BACT|nr:VCBS repeat-containing protein [Paraflavisolibacter caeni]MCU7550161.1 VCBS repeat-containing protein [Paraflavisolibacter caeni]